MGHINTTLSDICQVFFGARTELHAQIQSCLLRKGRYYTALRTALVRINLPSSLGSLLPSPLLALLSGGSTTGAFNHIAISFNTERSATRI